MRALPELSGPLDVALGLASAVQLIAFNPFVFWRFAWEFPRVQPTLLPSWLLRRWGVSGWVRLWCSSRAI